ncbi:nuclear transport factor 2 family protein [Sinorhizobium medicae]|nr:nuclear transport factor 2 family protein [Sinorhizobium medicae]
MDEANIGGLLDREAIRDCLYRYCRGIDRGDEAALRSAYWPDAHDNHGGYSGPSEDFIRLALGIFKTEPRNVHQIANILIEFSSPSEATVESYFTALQRGPDAGGEIGQVLLCGRYGDLFHKREGEWRIIARTVIYDWIEQQIPPGLPESERFASRRPIGAPYPNDPIYALLKGTSPRCGPTSEANDHD